MLQPGLATLPPIRQNAFYRLEMRLTDSFRDTTVDASGLLISSCHGFGINEKVVLLSQSQDASICGAAFNEIYYVSPVDYGVDKLRIAPVIGQSALNIRDAGDQRFWLARPFDITGYTIDSDICIPSTSYRVEVASFSTALQDAENGLFSLELDEATTVKLKKGSYVYDISLTPSAGERFYAVEGSVSVEPTRSR